MPITLNDIKTELNALLLERCKKELSPTYEPNFYKDREVTIIQGELILTLKELLEENDPTLFIRTFKLLHQGNINLKKGGRLNNIFAEVNQLIEQFEREEWQANQATLESMNRENYEILDGKLKQLDRVICIWKEAYFYALQCHCRTNTLKRGHIVDYAHPGFQFPSARFIADLRINLSPDDLQASQIIKEIDSIYNFITQDVVFALRDDLKFEESKSENNIQQKLIAFEKDRLVHNYVLLKNECVFPKTNKDRIFYLVAISILKDFRENLLFQEKSMLYSRLMSTALNQFTKIKDEEFDIDATNAVDAKNWLSSELDHDLYSGHFYTTDIKIGVNNCLLKLCDSSYLDMVNYLIELKETFLKKIDAAIKKDKDDSSSTAANSYIRMALKAWQQTLEKDFKKLIDRFTHLAEFIESGMESDRSCGDAWLDQLNHFAAELVAPLKIEYGPKVEEECKVDGLLKPGVHL